MKKKQNAYFVPSLFQQYLELNTNLLKRLEKMHSLKEMNMKINRKKIYTRRNMHHKINCYAKCSK